MKRLGIAVVLPVLLLGCAVDEEEVAFDDEEEELLGEAALAVKLENQLAPNALHANALHANALHANALHANALHANALTPSALTSLQDPGEAGMLSRMLIKYIVSCSLRGDQSFNFSWTDGLGVVQNVTYWGALGLAPDWSTRALYEDEQKWVTACLGSRLNYYGVSVIISMRGTHAVTTADAAERTSHSVKEGAFWGNLFSSTPWIRSCHIPGNEAHARSKQRACAAGHVQGEFTLACGGLARRGSCSALCVDRTNPANDPDDGFASCEGTTEVIATYLAN